MSENGASGADLERFARQAVDAAVAAGADQADAWCEDGVNRTIRVYDANVESLVEAGSRGVGVRAFRDGRTGTPTARTSARRRFDPSARRPAGPPRSRIRTSTPASPKRPERPTPAI